MTPILTRSEYAAERAQTKAEFNRVEPKGYDAWRVWFVTMQQALADIDRRFYARNNGFDRMIMAHREAVTVAEYLNSPKAERLAA